jgi:sugar phosphate isomerase/epimerase
MTYPRRQFLKIGAAIGAGVALQPLAGCFSNKNTNHGVGNLGPFGLQLYTLRDDLPKDPKGVLQKVASFGYKQIESYEHDKLGMFWGMSPQAFAAYLGGLGMTLVSSHCDIKKDFERKVEQAASIGMTYLACPWLGPNGSLDFYKKAAEQFNRCGELCKKAGLRFAYHNHDYSFLPVEGKLPQDVMMQGTDPGLVDYEMDIYWVAAAGQDPLQWFQKYPGRFTMAHVKDRKKGVSTADKDASTVLGTGGLHFASILKGGSEKGMKYFFVEQERYDGTTPLAAVEANAAYMKSLKI